MGAKIICNTSKKTKLNNQQTQNYKTSLDKITQNSASILQPFSSELPNLQCNEYQNQITESNYEDKIIFKKWIIGAERYLTSLNISQTSSCKKKLLFEQSNQSRNQLYEPYYYDDQKTIKFNFNEETYAEYAGQFYCTSMMNFETLELQAKICNMIAKKIEKNKKLLN